MVSKDNSGYVFEVDDMMACIINFKETAIKRNIKVNLYKKEENPELIKKIMQKFNIKPKYSRVFK